MAGLRLRLASSAAWNLSTAASVLATAPRQRSRLAAMSQGPIGAPAGSATAIAALVAASTAEDDALAQVAAAPASLEALAAKLHVFRHYYALEAADREPLEVEETTERMALAIALDVDALCRRAAAAGDASALAFRPIADLAARLQGSTEVRS
jgi:hypothetical protein